MLDQRRRLWSNITPILVGDLTYDVELLVCNQIVQVQVFYNNNIIVSVKSVKNNHI